mmetsp:Transcript_27863/g.43482  ORF Transcript_27863/g.43482 Transcript_27863/m.43482 type:complete len:81 (-) Transcript_27863:56-298(-)
MAEEAQRKAQEFLEAQQHYYKQLKEGKDELKAYQKSKEEHVATIHLLKDLPSKVRHDIMVPLGSLAFMPGQLVHTNETTV